MNSSQSLHKAYEQMIGKSLTHEQVAEIKFNLVKYVETLIQLDKQHKAWLEKQKSDDEDTKKTGAITHQR